MANNGKRIDSLSDNNGGTQCLVAAFIETTNSNNNQHGQSEWKQNKITCNTEYFSGAAASVWIRNPQHFLLPLCLSIPLSLSLDHFQPHERFRSDSVYRNTHQMFIYLFISRSSTQQARHMFNGRFTSCEWAHLLQSIDAFSITQCIRVCKCGNLMTRSSYPVKWKKKKKIETAQRSTTHASSRIGQRSNVQKRTLRKFGRTIPMILFNFKCSHRAAHRQSEEPKTQ